MFAFDVVSTGTPAEGAELLVKTVPTQCYCNRCDRLFHPPSWVYNCPHCQQPSTDICQGQDLQLRFPRNFIIKDPTTCVNSMCRQCGCNQAPPEPADTDSADPVRKTLHLQQQVLAKNIRYADRNRALFSHLLAVNVLSSPGSGKTTLLQQLLKRGNLLSTLGVCAGVIVGDLATERDAKRLHQAGIQAQQITTGNLCHLEANSVAKAAHQIDLATLDLLVIENVGNLVCPAAYDLGEDLRIVVMSVTEGEDKPLKYPTMFKSAQVVVVSKIDLADAVEFNREDALRHLHQIAPQAVVFELSAKTGEGMRDLANYLRQAIADCQHSNIQTDSIPTASPIISQRRL